MSNWTFRTHRTKDGRKVIYARSRQPERCDDGSIRYRQVERSCGTSSIQAAREKVREFDREYHEITSRGPATGKPLTFMDAAEQYLLSGNSGRYLEPILKKIGLTPITEIDQALMLHLAKKLYPNCAASTVNRQLFTPVLAVCNFVGHRLALKRPKGHDKLPAIDRTDLPPDGWFGAVLQHLALPKRALLLVLTIHGRRISEIAERTPEDLDMRRWTLRIPDSKTGEPFVLHLAEPVIDALTEMLTEQKRVNELRVRQGKKPVKPNWLFGTASRSNIQRDIRKACEQAGLRSYGTHRIGRHSFATRILEEGRSLAFLQKAGGWKSLKAVARYAHLAKSEVADEVREIGRRWSEGLKNVSVNEPLRSEQPPRVWGQRGDGQDGM
jgi:integrase